MGLSRQMRSRAVHWMAILSLVSCGGGTDPSLGGKGLVDVRLTLPPGRTDAIVLLRLAGGTISSVSAGTGVEVRATGIGSASVPVIIRGTFQGTVTVLSICVPDVSALIVAGYQLKSDLLQAAAGQSGGYAHRTDLGAYQLDLVNPRATSC